MGLFGGYYSKRKMVRDLYIANSKVHGLGVHTKRDYTKGETIFIIKGKKVEWHVTNQKESLYGPDWIGLSKTSWIDPNEPAKYLNHSCDPNAGIKGKVTVVAIKNIKKGAEITIDYSTTEIDHLWFMPCDCGAKNCRKTIFSIQSLPKKIFKKYLPYIPKYFMSIYNKINGQ